MTNYDILQEYEAHKTPVPSYQEFIELQEYKRIVTSYNMKPIDYEVACDTVNKLLDDKQKIKAENAQLKELLRERVQFEIEENPNDFTVISERMSELANKTKQAIGEE